jgi:hypothetical protein
MLRVILRPVPIPTHQKAMCQLEPCHLKTGYCQDMLPSFGFQNVVTALVALDTSMDVIAARRTVQRSVSVKAAQVSIHCYF